MATVKLCADIEQSRKLAGILPHESADMCYRYYSGSMINGYGDCVLAKSFITGKNVIRENDLPCWSLAALIAILPSSIKDSIGMVYSLNMNKEYIEYSNPNISSLYSAYIHTCGNNNLVDACYEMILKLHEHKMLNNC